MGRGPCEFILYIDALTYIACHKYMCMLVLRRTHNTAGAGRRVPLAEPGPELEPGHARDRGPRDCQGDGPRHAQGLGRHQEGEGGGPPQQGRQAEPGQARRRDPHDPLQVLLWVPERGRSPPRRGAGGLPCLRGEPEGTHGLHRLLVGHPEGGVLAQEAPSPAWPS